MTLFILIAYATEQCHRDLFFYVKAMLRISNDYSIRLSPGSKFLLSSEARWMTLPVTSANMHCICLRRKAEIQKSINNSNFAHNFPAKMTEFGVRTLYAPSGPFNQRLSPAK